MTDTEQIKEALKKPRLTKTAIDRKDLLSTGSTLLNLAMSGYPQGGIAKGWYVHFVGDSQCGKTFFAHQLLAEAANNPEFDEYRLVYDDIENGCLMNKEKFFGKKMASRLEPPALDENGEPAYSIFAEDMYYNIYDLLTVHPNSKKKPKPIIYVVDSLDALSSQAEEKKFKEHLNARKKNRQAAGSYGDGKAKINSANIRQVVARLRDTGSILFCISQTRDVLDAAMFGPSTTFSGGRALKFYTHMQLWGSVGSQITKQVKGKKVKQGMTSRIKVRKNRSTGKERTVDIPIYYSYGMDDIGSCINFLVEYGHWQSKGSSVSATEFDFGGKIEDLIEKIEDENLQTDLQMITTKVWNEIEKECELVRKPRYE